MTSVWEMKAAAPPAVAISPPTPTPARPRLRLTRLSTVQPREVEHLPGGYIPNAMFSLIGGDPGEGKTRLQLDLAAAVTRGRAWPEGSDTGAPGDVLFVGEEDTLEHVIRPVFDALGGDASRFYAIDGLIKEARDGTERESAFTLAEEGLDALEAVVKDKRPRLMLIDPVTGHLGNRDSWKDAEVRAALTPLARLSERYGMATNASAHLNKASQQAVAYRIGGTIAFRAVARAVFYVVPDPTDPTRQRRLLFHDKSNVGAKRAPRGYTIIDKDGVGIVAWDRDPVTVTLQEALGLSGGADDQRQDTEAMTFLRELLTDKPLSAGDVDAARRNAGIAPRTLERAKARLSVRSVRRGFGKDAVWLWELPTTIDRHIPPTSDSMASNGEEWRSMEDEDRHRTPKTAIDMKDATGGGLCVECGRPANALDRERPVCFGHHPLGTAAKVGG